MMKRSGILFTGKKIILILIGVSVTLFADFSRDDTLQIVRDNETGLEWQDDSDAKTITKNWKGAIEYCEALTLGGYSDWRLPNLNELTSLVDDTRYDPAMDTAFQNVVSGDYWSSTTYASYTLNAWVVNFHNGGQRFNGHYKYTRHYVRCVRGGE